MTLLLGIDPGASGGIAWRTASAVLPGVRPFEGEVHTRKMPDARPELHTLLKDLRRTHEHALVAIERQEPRPTYVKRRAGQACPTCERPLERDATQRTLLKSSAVLFGGYCALVAMLELLEFSIYDVRPVVWQATVGLPQKGGKPAAKNMAAQRFPGTKVTLWNADALLLLEYVQRMRALSPQQPRRALDLEFDV